MTYKIAIPKGSLFDNSREYLNSKNIDFELIPRKLLLQTNNPDIEILIVRPTDVAVYVERGAVDAGIVGSKQHRRWIGKLHAPEFGSCVQLIGNVHVAVNQPGQYKRIREIVGGDRIIFICTELGCVHESRFDSNNDTIANDNAGLCLDGVPGYVHEFSGMHHNKLRGPQRYWRAQ